jgi:PiT family inorganic phosphate transporter
MDWSILPLLLMGFYIGWNIGANDAANCIGTIVGSRWLSYRRAIVLMAVFVVLGALLQGQGVMQTVGKGIVTAPLSMTGIFVAMLSAGLFVTAATWFKLPVSTSQAIVGGVAGVGFSIGAPVDMGKMWAILQVWVVCPILTALMSFLLYQLFSWPLTQVRRMALWDRVLGVFVIITAAYLAFSLGANNLGSAIGPLSSLDFPTAGLALLGGVAMVVGALTFGGRVTETVGQALTTIDPIGAVAAQTSAALAVHFFSIVGIPVSTSQAVVGAVAGIALIRGSQALSKGKVIEVVGGWVAVPLIAGGFAFLLYKLVSFFAS